MGLQSIQKSCIIKVTKKTQEDFSWNSFTSVSGVP